MKQVELEKTYLLKFIPEDLKNFPSLEYIDLYIPENAEHPVIRIRKRGDKMEITKKVPVKGKDSSVQYEHTIPLSREEFQVLVSLPGKRIRKIRYFYPVGELTSEIDIFQDALEGFTEVDFEFKTIEEKDAFSTSDFCLVEVTQEKFAAGGVLAGKTYKDIEPDLDRLSYTKLTLL